ncbi:MAG TPA: beta-L-arabinofuranosidase domain-containing protein [Ktedonobacteraceae bacterium]|nr:beta-L-arabinofuranosidase domain-containing protein [Ktedonobacteraceae bacterium]
MAQKETRLSEPLFRPLPPGHIHPVGWLRQQLQIQADGLAGHLDECWPDVAQSGWIGGTAESWERGPYWLDGIVPLAYLLDDAALKAKVVRWVEAILSTQREDGWLGPQHDSRYGYPDDPWPVSIVAKALIQYQEAANDPRVLPALLRFFSCLRQQLAQRPLQSWASMRCSELLWSLYWVYERTQEEWLLELSATIQEQGYDWIAHFANFTWAERQQTWTHEAHVVNTAMALKYPGLCARLSQEIPPHSTVSHFLETLDRFHGQVTGVFSGDEVLAGKNPSQGTELCAVVEYLFSLEVLLSLVGELDLAERWERIAFNALPAAFTPDMWAHQYDQQVNQVQCVISDNPIYTTNGPAANIFGLEPNFGCCTANMGQGWPKFATHLWMRTSDEGLVAWSYAPCQVSTILSGQPVQVTVTTEYPFTETIHMTVRTEQPVVFALRLRIPSWTQGATIQIAEQQQTVQAGTWYQLARTWMGEETVVLSLPMPIQTQRRYHQSLSLERGPLVYALPLGEAWTQIGGELPHADWEVRPTTPWNYALVFDPAYPEQSCQVVKHPMTHVPFSPQGAPLGLRVLGRQLPDWQFQNHAAGSLPFSPVESGEPLQQLELIPYGCTNLRLTEFPILAP